MAHRQPSSPREVSTRYLQQDRQFHQAARLVSQYYQHGQVRFTSRVHHGFSVPVHSRASPVHATSSVDNNTNGRFVLSYLKTKIHVNPKGEIANEEPEICAVCHFLYEERKKIASLHYGHEFHVDCIKIWFLRKNECPMCRETAIPINVNKLPTHRFHYRVECYD